MFGAMPIQDGRLIKLNKHKDNFISVRFTAVGKNIGLVEAKSHNQLKVLGNIC